jgi:chemosensory pili system protein ChpA (sensor histidine kinase/response regulator)
MSSNSVAPGDNEQSLADLGPLAWVLDELRKSLDGSVKALRRFVRDAELARGSDLSDLDASNLRIARQQLHQAVGALEMVGLQGPAKILRAMESLAQKFVQRPELCSEDAASKVERASFAMAEFLEGMIKGKSASPVALFPQYRSVMELIGGDRAHPADLWPVEWRWMNVALQSTVEPQAYGPSARAKLDRGVLAIMKSDDAGAARRVGELCAGFAAAQTQMEPRSFWAVCAGYFEASAQGLIASDVYTKQVASRVLRQYASCAKGDTSVSERLARDLVFFCSLAASGKKPTPALDAVRAAYGLTLGKPVDYAKEQFGRFDPALLVLARKRIAATAETWSLLAGGDTNRLSIVAEQFAAVADSVVKLHAESSDLARALMRAIESTVRSGVAPAPAVAMEVATAVLYLEAAYEDLDPTDSEMGVRGTRLAQRLEHVCAGGQQEPLESWMEELYRRVSDRQTMGSVVDELRSTLAEVERSLDQFFRNPQDKMALQDVPSRLSQMRGVFSVLGLDQASLAALRMRGSVEQFMLDGLDDSAERRVAFEKLGNSLGAMGFLVDMLSYQRTLAKKLFVYDEELGEFKPLMGRERTVVEPPAAPTPIAPPPVEAPAFDATQPISVADTQALTVPLVQAPQVEHVTPVDQVPAPVAKMPSAVVAQEEEDDDDGELLDIFLEEAREVVGNAADALSALTDDPTNLAEQTTLRRSFHTLKGSSRMVGLNEFGEAAWSFEQLLNARLAEQRPASPELITAIGQAMEGFGRWIEDIANGSAEAWSAQNFRTVSDGLRLENRWLPLQTPHVAVAEQEAQVSPAVEAVTVDVLPAPESALELAEDPAPEHMDFAHTEPFEHQEVEQVANATEVQEVDFGDFNFEGLSPEVVVATEADVPLDFDTPETLDTQPTIEAVEMALPVVEEVSTLETVEPEPEVQVIALESESVADQPSELIDEQVKVIGHLRLGIPLYNVFLNEADERSRRLQIEMSEWALELHRPLPDSLVTLAHSLSGSSATVGFTGLSEMARTLEHALQHVQLHQPGTAEQAAVFNDATEDIRRLLHQFAAGFLKEPSVSILQALQDIIETEFPAPTMQVASDDLDEAEEDELATGPTSVYVDLMDESSPEPESEPVTLPEVPQLHAPAAPVVAAAPLNIADAQVDDIDAIDALDDDLFPVFQDEAVELMPQMGAALRQWVAHPDNLSARNEVLRVLHTLKGSARLAGAMRLGEMSHRMESSIEHIGSEGLQTVQLEPLLTRFDTLQSTFDALGKPQPVEQQAVASVAEPVSAPVAPGAASATPSAPIQIMPRGLVLEPLKQQGNQSVRVRSQLLDRLVNQAGEVMITRARMDARLTQLRASLGELTGNLDRLRKQLRDVELQAESQVQSRLAQAKDTAQSFDPLEFDRFTRVQELTRMMAESVNDVATVQRNIQRSIEGAEDDLIAQGRQARELQRDLLRTRMVEFESISERLYGVVRQAAKETGKQVKLDIVGGSIEMDRGVLERMAPAFEHMLRNAIVHGIEDAETRLAAAKSAIGSITIHVTQESNDVSVAFSDDGGGLRMDKIRAKAVSLGLVSADAELSEAESANLLFTPGFSTADQVTELAGRGIGMDVVRAEVNALGGRIETTTAQSKGTSFKLVLPLTTAVTQVVMLRMGEFTIGVPSSLMETVMRVPVAKLEQAYQSNEFEIGGQSIPFFWAGALLQVSPHSTEAQTKTMSLAVMRSAGQRLAVHVDEVLGNREVVVKNLGPQLARLPGLAGVSVLASGAVALIYNLVALVSVYGEQARQMRKPAAVASAVNAAVDAPTTSVVGSVNEIPLVLVVDDSITVRRVTQRLLKREGYRVALAADGLQALEKLQEERPAVVLSDIEMPRMDGFDLARNIRGDDRLKDLPIIMITSRIAGKHREHAKDLGVDHYLGKPYSEEELLNLVRSYCNLPVNA